ncbi:leucyl aminopeptidase [Candidatus Marinamargulisbacteria bacterium SCGC AG-343-D04]|nr:leucyl aminopeptidase [Candidatus Marinamargulisbacteria bacterium SCGC AG-343-D04]
MDIRCKKKAAYVNSDEHDIIVYQVEKEIKKLVKKTSVDAVLESLKETKQLCDEKTTCTSFPLQNGDKAKTVILVGVAKAKTDMNAFRHAGGEVSRQIKSKKLDSVSLWFTDSIDEESAGQFCEGIHLGGYEFNRFKTGDDNKESHQAKITIRSSESKALKKAVSEARIHAEAQCVSRDLANTPANFLTPKDFSDYAKKLFKGTDVEVKIHKKKDLEKMKMGAFLAVAQGSQNEPYLVELLYNNASKKKPTVLVGKGVTFDTGGISIKPSKSMSDMKADMSGAAAVIGAIYGIQALGRKTNVCGLIPLAENMPSSSAYKPGDVVTSMNGKTIEVINTDAEGRLLLADALCYATTKKPALIVDIATLTGACSIALGDVASAILGNNQKEIESICNQETKTGERFWQLPLYEEYKEYLKSDVADLLNCSENRLAGTATAAIFLEHFIENYPWIHLDIASMMDSSATKGFQIKGMTGFGCRTLISIFDRN